jgi:hypothetical protein
MKKSYNVGNVIGNNNRTIISNKVDSDNNVSEKKKSNIFSKLWEIISKIGLWIIGKIW